MCDPVGIVEIADRLEVSRHTVHKWRQRRVMPEPRWTVGGGPCWDWPDVQVWAFHSRRRGRGPTKGPAREPAMRERLLEELDQAEARVAEWNSDPDRAVPLKPVDLAVCPRCSRLFRLYEDGSLEEHQLPPGRVRHDGSTLCPGAG